MRSISGGFVSGLEYATDSTAEVVGKPQAAFFHEAVRDIGVHPCNTVMIGDVSAVICHTAVTFSSHLY